jgi:hypothetical protein
MHSTQSGFGKVQYSALDPDIQNRALRHLGVINILFHNLQTKLTSANSRQLFSRQHINNAGTSD